MFANMKIGVRLTLGFFIVLALMAALALVGINGMSKMQGRLDEIVNDNFYKTKLINDMKEAVHIVSRITRTLILLTDEAAMATQKKKLDGVRQQYNDAWANLEKTPASEKGKAIRARIRSDMVDARAINDKVIDLALATSLNRPRNY